MNITAKLEQFRSDNPYDVETQAKRLLAKGDDPLLLYVLALGLTAAKQRQRHLERDYIKTVGAAPPKERIKAGRVTGSIKIVPSRKMQNTTRQFILDIWRVGEQKLGDATANDLTVAISREIKSSNGHQLNAQLYTNLKKPLGAEQAVREQWDEATVRNEIETVYGEFRKTEAA